MEALIVTRFLNFFFVLSCLSCSNALFSGFQSKFTTSIIYVGSYSHPDGIGTGIVILAQNQSTNNYEYFDNVTTISPSALAMDSRKRLLYSVNERNRFKGEIGFVSCYKIPRPKIGLAFVSNQSSLGWQPNFITLDPSGTFLMVSNYGTGNVVIYRVQNGRMHLTNDVHGFGRNAHQIVFNPKHSIAAIPYLGSDLVLFYTLDKVRGKFHPYRVLLKNDTRVHLSAAVRSGTGPRHLVHSKDGRYFYVIGELLSTITVFRTDINEETGQYTAIQVIDLLPTGYNGRKWASAIVMHPNDRFLYASERGIHHIIIFKINASNGKLELLGYRHCGKIPRHMVIRPLGKKHFQLFVTNEGDHAIQVFNIDENGYLNLDYTIEGINSPTYLQFYP